MSILPYQRGAAKRTSKKKSLVADNDEPVSELFLVVKSKKDMTQFSNVMLKICLCVSHGTKKYTTKNKSSQWQGGGRGGGEGGWPELGPLDYKTIALNPSTRLPSLMLFSYLSKSLTSPQLVLCISVHCREKQGCIIVQ